MSKLREVLRTKEITQFELSRKSNVTPADISAVLNNKKPCFPAWRKRISEALDTSEEELFPEYSKEA